MEFGFSDILYGASVVVVIVLIVAVVVAVGREGRSVRERVDVLNGNLLKLIDMLYVRLPEPTDEDVRQHAARIVRNVADSQGKIVAGVIAESDREAGQRGQQGSRDEHSRAQEIGEVFRQLTYEEVDNAAVENDLIDRGMLTLEKRETHRRSSE